MNMTDPNKPKKIHEGRNVKRFREMLGIKQDALAASLGRDWSQKKISLLESRQLIHTKELNQIARVLKVPIEAIRAFDEQQALHNIKNNFEHTNCAFNPIEKLVETIEELKSLYIENKNLYERLLQSESTKQQHL